MGCKYEYIPEIKEYLNVLALDKSVYTISSYVSSINRFFDFIDVKTFDNIKAIVSSDCRNYLAHLKESIQASSINAHLRPLKILFNWLVTNEYLETSPFGKVKYIKEPKKEKEFLSEEEVERLMGACKRLEDKVIIAIMLTAGLRRSEITGLKLKDFIDCHIKVFGKGSKERTLVLQPEICDLLNLYIQKRNKKHGDKYEWLFVSKAKVSKLNGRFSGNAIREKVKGALRRAGLSEDRISQIGPHNLRHTFTANLLESGADIRVAQAALGHSNISTTMRYAHLRNSALDKAMLNQKSIFSQ